MKIRFNITLVIFSMLLLGMISGSDADFEIVEVRPFYHNYELYDTGGGVSHYTYAKTSQPHDYCDWYVDGIPAGFSNYDDGFTATEASNYFYVGEGTVFGKSYTIAAEAGLTDDGKTFFATDSYEVTVYTEPVTDEITSGHYTMATMYGEVDVGWNGTTAEVRAYGKITNNTPHDIVYGIRIHYVVGMLQRNNDDLAQQLDAPDQLLIDFGVIKANADDNDRDYSYSDSYTLGDGGRRGRRYIVEATVTVTAQISGGDPNKIDVLLVPEQQILTIPDSD